MAIKGEKGEVGIVRIGKQCSVTPVAILKGS